MFNGEQEKWFIICVRMGQKQNTSLVIIVCHHSAGFEIPNGDPQVGGGGPFHLDHYTHDIVVFSITFFRSQHAAT